MVKLDFFQTYMSTLNRMYMLTSVLIKSSLSSLYTQRFTTPFVLCAVYNLTIGTLMKVLLVPFIIIVSGTSSLFYVL